MSKKASKTEFYANSITEDFRTRFVSEKSTKYTDTEIERLYEFEDGAVVKYEWRAFPGEKPGENFNHRFSIVKIPKPNPDKIKVGIIKVIEHPVAER